MKTLNLLFLFTATFLTLNLSAKTNMIQNKNAGEYLTSINETYKPISSKVLDYTSAVANDKSARKIEKTRTSLITEIKTAITKIKSMPDYEGDGSYRDAVIEYLTMNQDVLNNEYSKIVDLEAVAEESYDMMEAYLRVQEEAGNKMREASEKMHEQLMIFAKKHDVTILEAEETKVSKRLKQADRMWKYYNEIYLIFFKSYKQEVYLMDGISKGDVNAIEQNKSSLAEFSNEGLNKLKKNEGFDGDMSIKEACVNMLNFYKKEAEVKVPIIVDFYLKKEHFEKVQKNFEGLSKKEKTQEAIDEFNKAVNEYNESANKYNATNEELNKERAKLIDDWNKTGSKFKSKHVK